VRVVIVGAGLIGFKRAAALTKEDQIVALVEPDNERALAFQNKFGEVLVADIDSACKLGADVFFIATPHNQLQELAMRAVASSAHVLLEKPAAISSAQCFALAELAAQKNVIVRVGYNHRFHPAICEAWRLFGLGVIGEIMFLRARYGHGGRLGYEREWRANASISGGGELVDQGAHLLDLAQMFLGKLEVKFADLPTLFWDMAVEDTAFVSLQNNKGARAWLQAGWTEWKNIFSFEIMGKTGKIMIEGLGGSYGRETLTFYKMSEKMGPPEVSQIFYDEDNSWHLEWLAFIADMQKKSAGIMRGANISEAAEIWQLIEKAQEYKL
jgi:predicted dehydrogenase